MTSVSDVLDTIYGLLPTPTIGTGKTFDRWYKQSYPDGHAAEYFGVINTLGVPADPIQDVIVNVNAYARDIDVHRGIPDLSALNSMAAGVVGALHNYNNDEVDIEFQIMNIIRDDSQRHYMNMRFIVVYINN